MKAFIGIGELLTLEGALLKKGRYISESDLSVINDGAIIEKNGKVLWVGKRSDLKTRLKKLKIKSVQEINLKAKCVLPSFIDCHTHLVFSGQRQNEFELRNQGVSYQDIAKQGGGIQTTVNATKYASEKELYDLAAERLLDFVRQGVAAVEIKSGYGLSEKAELKILKLIKKLKKNFHYMNIIATYLGPHTIPKDKTSDVYLRQIMDSTLPKIKKMELADRVDMFVESGYYTNEQAKLYFSKAKELGFLITAHTDQLTNTRAGVLLANLGALSVDHLVHIGSEDIRTLGLSETTCVLLPASDFYLKMAYPPARQLLEVGARVALSTDYNPGTSPTRDIGFVGVLARLNMKMTLPEVIVAYTLNAAYALGLNTKLGVLSTSYDCSFSVLNCSWRDIFYQIGSNPVKKMYFKGKLVPQS